MLTIIVIMSLCDSFDPKYMRTRTERLHHFGMYSLDLTSIAAAARLYRCKSDVRAIKAIRQTIEIETISNDISRKRHLEKCA